jgi:predicted component of type VI protein secretion system
MEQLSNGICGSVAMTFSLTVLSAGAMQGKVIQIPLAHFLMGRSKECNLRPSSPGISKRHCSLITRGGKVFVKDFASTNGTFINDQPIEDEREVKDGDCLQIGPLAFRINVEHALSVREPAPLPAAVAKQAVASDDEEAAALLLAMQENEASAPASNDQEEPEGAGPSGSTIVDPLQNIETSQQQTPLESGPAKREVAAKASAADTSAAAKAILDRYVRLRRRS